MKTPIQDLNKLLIERNQETNITSITIGLLSDLAELDEVMGDEVKMNELLNKWKGIVQVDKKPFHIEINETKKLSCTVTVVAENKEDALELVDSRYNDGEYDDELFAEYAPDYTVEVVS